jgi:hypothetical protein
MKPIWMHVTFSTVILVGAVLLIRHQIHANSRELQSTAQNVVVSTGEQLAAIVDTRIRTIAQDFLGSDGLTRPGGTGRDSDILTGPFGRNLRTLFDRANGSDLDLPGISLAEENTRGKTEHLQRLWNINEYKDPILNQRLQQLAQPTVKECQRKKAGYTITVVNDSEINAGSAIGGYIYVNTGLIAKYPSDAELQFVLAHEIAHIELAHAARRYATMNKVWQGGETNPSLRYEVCSHFARGYDSKDELAADEFAFDAMCKHGWTSDGAMTFLRRAERAEAEDSDTVAILSRWSDDFAGAQQCSIRSHFKTQPPVSARLKRLNAKLLPPSPKSSPA